MIIQFALYRPFFFRNMFYPFCHTPKRDLPQCSQFFPAKKMIQRPHRLRFFINLSLFHPVDQVLWFDVDHFHLIGMIKHGIRDPLAYPDPCDIFHHII